MPELNPKVANAGLNLSNITSQIKQGQLSWAVNSVLENFDGNKITYSNEQGNTLSTTIPIGYRVIGHRYILEENFTIFWLVNPKTGDNEIGTSKEGVYTKLINAKCLNLSIEYPILKTAHKNTNCGLDVYWVDRRNRFRYIQYNKLPYKEVEGDGCENILTDDIDCNKLNVQPNFNIIDIDVEEADGGGSLISGTYQFAAQYGNALGEPYTSFYSVTNPASLFDGTQASQTFDYPVNKSLKLTLNNIDDSGVYEYFNLAVIKTINNITSVNLVGTYRITNKNMVIEYTGQQKDEIELSINDIFQRYATYDAPGDLTVAQDVIILADLQGEERVSYQQIANKIKLYWQTKRIKGKNAYKDINTTVNDRSGMRDDTYPYSLVFELDNGYITDHFPMIGREATTFDLELISNRDVITNSGDTECEVHDSPVPRWKIYNTGNVIDSLHPSNVDECYEGDWEYGEFAYTESTELYDCNTAVWGELANKPIRHFKFPDCNITHIHDNEGYIYPIGVRINVQEVVNAIKQSSLTDVQKSRIRGVRVVRGNRSTHESVMAKGLIHNVLKSSTENNIIDATSGASAGTASTAESNTRNMLNQAYDYTRKAHKESNAYAFLSIIGTITIGKNVEQNKRYNSAENLIDDVRKSSNPFTDVNVARLTTASEILQDIIDNSDGDARGKAHAQAAKALVDGLIQIITAQIEIDVLLAETALNTSEQTNANEFQFFPNYLFNDVRIGNDGSPADFFLDNTFIDDDAKKRYTLHSPDSSFYQPRLGNILKLETAEFGVSSGHLVEVKKHARYQFISTTGYITALLAGVSIGFASGSYGVGSVNVFNGEAAFTSYQAFLDILYKTVPRKNFAYQWNAVGEYTNFQDVPNEGNKQRYVDIASYMSPGIQNMGDIYSVNNFQRESSIYLRTLDTLPFPHEIMGVPKDASKLAGASYNILQTPISSYYASLKTFISNQYGQIGSYEVVDTGWRKDIDVNGVNYTSELVMGGDVFINRFAYKSKIPFFIDNRVGFPDGADISYNELSNVGRVKYWFSTDVTAKTSIFDSFFATMTQHFFWPQISELYMNGKIFLFAYGIPYFFCESTVNVDMRQAFNNKEGDFYPHASSGIPDEWLQEINTPISQDNTYFYNKSFSKQNKETYYSSLPSDYDFDSCRTSFPNRGVFSEQSTDSPNPSNRNNWRIFKPSAYFDFPQNYGKLISLDGIETRQVLARFETKTLLYNALLTAPTSAADVYLGSSLFSRQVPPLDYADTDNGYMGTTNKFILKTPYGDVTVDSNRGKIFIIQGQKVQDITGDISQFFSEFGEFQINKQFPSVNIDNHYKGIGLTGVFDDRYNRIIITKLDYKPLFSDIILINDNFYYNGKRVLLTDVNYFCNYSFTISYSLDVSGWVSVHTYLPNYYINIPNRFNSGINGILSNTWEHNTSINKWNNFYNKIDPYILEYPYSFSFNDEILQNIKDYSRVLQYNDYRELIETDEYYFNKMICYSSQQSTGILELAPKPIKNLSLQRKYPIYNKDSKTVLVTKSNSFYNVNTFWDMIKDRKKPVFIKSCNSISEYKMLNQTNHDYTKLSFKKQPIRTKDLRIRLILDDKDSVKIISQFIVAPTIPSYK